MKRFHPPTLLAAALALAAVGASAQNATLAPQAERISDAVIQQDHAAYERVQARIKALNDGGRRVADYHLSKAQCWLDASFHEYTRNDRSAFPQAAMSESDKLVAAMEQRREPLPNDTPLVNGAARLRPDLWDRLGALSRAPGFVCAAQAAACAEVELVHAGNEFNQQGWRHAKPYVQIAEDLVARAASQAEQCLPAPRGAAAAPVPAPVPAAPRDPVVIKLNVVFEFDRSAAASIRPASRADIDQVVKRIQSERLRVDAIKLVGHADRLNGTGKSDYNLKLSEKRAMTVRQLLAARGLDARIVDITPAGDSAPVENCKGPRNTRSREVEECLQPNRRVDVEITAFKAP